MDGLWAELGGPGAPPEADVSAVKDRVNAALNADPGERKVYMKQKLRMALVLAAAIAAVTGSTLAASGNWNVLHAFFKGDTSPAQAYVDETARTVSDENYTMTVESVVSDESRIYLVVSVTALSDEAKAFLPDEFFVNMDTWWVRSAETDAYLQKNPGAADLPSDLPAISGFGGGELDHAPENTRRFDLYGNFQNGTPSSVLFRLSYMDKDAVIEIPVSPAPSVTVEVNGSGLSRLDMDCPEPKPLTIRRVTLTPFTCTVETAPECTLNAQPNLQFRMADGTIHTQAQMMKPTESTAAKFGRTVNNVYNYRFYEVQDLKNIASIITFDMEYPLDGSKPFPVEHDPALDPFLIPMTDQLRASLGNMGGFPVPVRALTEGLGGTCQWDAATGSITCTYRGVTVVITPGSNTATVRGEDESLIPPGFSVKNVGERIEEYKEAPQARYITDDGSGGHWVVVAPYYIFEKAWSIDGFVTYTCGEEIDNGDGSYDIPTTYHDWYVIP